MKSESIWDKPASHGEILKKIWKHLDLATLERTHPFHTPVFGTVGNGCAPGLRAVVLRRFWRKPPRLAFHSHIGAPKIEEIKNNHNVSFLFYHPQEKLQLRVCGAAQVHADGDALHEEQWLATGFFSRRAYVGDAPSQISKHAISGLPAEISDRQPTAEESEAGRANFVVISSTIESIDCLELDFKGNRRSLFKWTKTGAPETDWLTP